MADNDQDVTEVPVGLGQMQPMLEAVAKRYKLHVGMMRARGKTATVLEARQLCCWLAVKLTRLSKEEIAQVFGKHKTSVGLAVSTIDQLRKREPSVLRMSDELLAELREA